MANFPGYPLDATKADSTAAPADHPSHHNQLATAVNDLQDQVAVAVLTSGTQTVAGTKTFSGEVHYTARRPYFDVVGFGADPTGSANSATAFTSWINAINASGGARAAIPAGAYRIDSALPNITVPTVMFGDGAGNNGTYSTVLNFAAGIPGLAFLTGADRSEISNMVLHSASSTLGTDDGLTLRGNAIVVRNVTAMHFGRDGISVDTSGGGNANYCSLDHCRAFQNKRDGFHYFQNNSNVIMTLVPSATSNARWGFYNASTLNNNYVGIHAAANGTARTFTNIATTIGSAVITSATADWVAGDWVVASGVPVGAYVASVAGTSATLAVAGPTGAPAATATATGVSAVITTGGAVYDNSNSPSYVNPYVEPADGGQYVALDTSAKNGVWDGGAAAQPAAVAVRGSTYASTWTIRLGGTSNLSVPDVPLLPSAAVNKTYTDTKASLVGNNVFAGTQQIVSGAGANMFTAAQSLMGSGASAFWSGQGNVTNTFNSAIAIDGNATCQMASIAAGTQYTLAGYIAVTGSTDYIMTVRMMAATVARSTRFQLNWYDSTHTSISTPTAGATADVVGTPITMSATVTSPSNAAYIRIGVEALSTAINEVHAFTEATLQLGSAPTLTLDSATVTSTGTLSISAPQVNVSTGLTVPILTLSNATLPTATSALRGQMRVVQGAAGVADAAWLCIKNAADAYVWQAVL